MAGVTSIGHASGEAVVGVGTQAWNIADGYMKIKVLRLLIEVDMYETIAMFGRQDLEEDIPQEVIPYKRVEALNRVLFDLRQVIGNCRFSIDEKKDKEYVVSYLERIDNVENNMKFIAEEKENAVTHEHSLEINEEHFRKCTDVLRNVKDELNFAINRAGLIFRHDDSIDLDSVMRSIVEGG